MRVQFVRSCLTRTLSFPGLSPPALRPILLRTVSISVHHFANRSTLSERVPRLIAAIFNSSSASIKPASRPINTRSVHERRDVKGQTLVRFTIKERNLHERFGSVALYEFLRSSGCDLIKELEDMRPNSHKTDLIERFTDISEFI